MPQNLLRVCIEVGILGPSPEGIEKQINPKRHQDPDSNNLREVGRAIHLAFDFEIVDKKQPVANIDYKTAQQE